MLKFKRKFEQIYKNTKINYKYKSFAKKHCNFNLNIECYKNALFSYKYRLLRCIEI